MLSIYDQLQAASAAPKAAPKQTPQSRLENLKGGPQATAAKALARYRAVMIGNGWVTQAQIEHALGYAATVSTLYIRKLYQRGIIERRNRGGAPKFSSTQGYEYRWIPGN